MPLCCTITLLFAISVALLYFTTLVHYSVALFYCNNLLQYSIALLFPTNVLHLCIVLLYDTTHLHYSITNINRKIYPYPFAYICIAHYTQYNISNIQYKIIWLQFITHCYECTWYSLQFSVSCTVCIQYRRNPWSTCKERVTSH